MSGIPDKQRILIFGGTFNPIHNGHVALAKAAAERLSVGKLLIIPDNIPPHKSADYLAGGEDRYNMCRLAFDGYAKAEVSDIELKQEGKSYTVKTVARLRRLFPDSELYLLMGTDMFLTFEQWNNYRKIAQNAILCAAARNEDQYNSLKKHAKALEQESIRSVVIDIQPFEVSSTQVRERLSNGQSCDGLLPDKVIQYIEQKGLYKNEI